MQQFLPILGRALHLIFKFMNAEIKDYFRGGKIKVWKEKFAIVKSRKPFPNSFAVIRDKNEITSVIDQSEIKDNKNIIKIEKDWKLLTFGTVLPFGLVGFLAKISGLLAGEGIGIFVISAYSTDHIFIKEKDINKAIKKLESAGFKIIK